MKQLKMFQIDAFASLVFRGNPAAVCPLTNWLSDKLMQAIAAGIPEDPITGSIHCSLIPYWGNRLGKTQLYAKQVSNRGGELWCEAQQDRVIISGCAVRYFEGEIYF